MLRVIAVSMLMVGSAVAEDVPEGLAGKIAEQARACWNLLPVDMRQENALELDVQVEVGGGIDGTPAMVVESGTLGKVRSKGGSQMRAL